MATGIGSGASGDGRRTDALLATMAGGTYAVLLLGIYTAAIGAGLTCDGRWPLCDGAVFGLFPANWPSFVEWFHRLIAMLTGFLIIGGWIIVWQRRRSRRARIALSAAVLLLPVQIWLGAETVWGYEIITLTAHFLTALVIFSGVLLGITWHWGLEHNVRKYSRRLLAGALFMIGPFLLLSPHFLVIHTGRIQVLYYGIGLLIFATLLLLTVGVQVRLVRGLSAISGALLALQLLAGRLVRTSTIELLDWAAGALLVVVLAVALWIDWRGTQRSGHVN